MSRSQGLGWDTYGICGLDEGVVDGNNVDIVVFDTGIRVRRELWEGQGFEVKTDAFLKTWEKSQLRKQMGGISGTHNTTDTTEAVDSDVDRHIDRLEVVVGRSCGRKKVSTNQIKSRGGGDDCGYMRWFKDKGSTWEESRTHVSEYQLWMIK